MPISILGYPPPGLQGDDSGFSCVPGFGLAKDLPELNNLGTDQDPLEDALRIGPTTYHKIMSDSGTTGLRR